MSEMKNGEEMKVIVKLIKTIIIAFNSTKLSSFWLSNKAILVMPLIHSYSSEFIIYQLDIIAFFNLVKLDIFYSICFIIFIKIKALLI